MYLVSPETSSDSSASLLRRLTPIPLCQLPSIHQLIDCESCSPNPRSCSHESQKVLPSGPKAGIVIHGQPSDKGTSAYGSEVMNERVLVFAAQRIRKSMNNASHRLAVGFGLFLEFRNRLVHTVDLVGRVGTLKNHRKI